MEAQVNKTDNTVPGSMGDFVRIRGARELKDVSLEIPRNALVVFTGVSGSVRRGPAALLESVSPYARRDRHAVANCQIHPSSDGRSGKRRLGFDQSLLFKLGPEFGGDFALQRIIVLGDLVMASRPDDKGDRDIWRC
jgi:hypothetical protein